MNSQILKQFIENAWDKEILPTLENYIKIPNKSPAFDPHWQQNGYMQKAVDLITKWCLNQNIQGMKCEVLSLPHRTPLIYLEIPGQTAETILLYGHCDKQPEMEGWHAPFEPWKPVIQDGKLYGRGGADDGYSVFAALTAIKALQEQKIKHARCVIVIEASEESGSLDLPFYLEDIAPMIGEPDFVICLDSGCGNYSQLWSTTSLRGLADGVLQVEMLEEGVHSGNGSGIYASSFRVLRSLLERIEDVQTGQIKLISANISIPAQRVAQAKQAAHILGKTVYTEFPICPGVQPVSDDLCNLILNRSWRPTLCITGMDDIPSIENGGNVLRPKTTAKLSMRLPPTADSKAALQELKEVLEASPPYNAKVTFNAQHEAKGWEAPELAPWLEEACEQASQTYYGKSAAYMGEGGSIPFMGMLGRKFPKAQFLITGVLGPHSNAHGPNEFLHLDYVKKLTCCISEVIAKHAQKTDLKRPS